MNLYHAQIESACRAALVLGPARYLWFGKPESTDPLPVTERRAMTPAARRGYLLASLRRTLYANFYCQGSAMPVRRSSAGGSRASAARFVEQLAAANASAGCWEDGWVVQQAAGGHGDAVMLAREDRDLAVRALPGEYVAPPGALPSAGSPARLHLPKEYPGLAPGFYMAAGDTPLPGEREQRVLRLYWHVTPQGAVRLVRTATAELNAAGIPFRLKALDDPTAYRRCDAAVLYIYDYDWGELACLLARLHAELAPDLLPAVPAFTKALGAGLGLAEDPSGEMSFGVHRCELVADALIRAYERGDSAPETRVRAVEERFAEEAIRLDAPYLNPESADAYVLAVPPVVIGDQRPDATPHEVAGRPGGPVGWLDVAAGIGDRLVRAALWHRGRCNWVGPPPDDAVRPPSAYTLPSGASPACAALGPDLYAGTSGVALFLAALAASTNDTGARRTAVAAIRQALERADVVPHELRVGLYAGWTGIALAAVRVGLLLDREDLVRGAVDLLQRLFKEKRTGRDALPAHDLMSGSAGVIVALVALAKLLSEPALLERAAELGDDLLRTARVNDGGYSWATPDRPRQRHLTGLAHGAAGIGCALLELAAVTGGRDYRQAAEMAFQYERGCFDAAAGNWPDFRDVPATLPRMRRTGQLVTLPYAVAWCHGAPGIALSRLRAYALLGRDAYRDEALIALGTAARAVRSMLDGCVDDYSLCHGLAGCADILLDGYRTLGPELADDAAPVEEVATYGAAAYAAPDAAWPCGFVSGESPSLMRGLAGIGYFYLRLSDPDVPSVLLPL